MSVGRSALGVEHSAPQGAAVFLSYAREDAAAARRIADALRAAGVEVWFDQSELRGGDAWDAKIRKQIKECSLFVPIISANTQSRPEGYFRLEWRLADQRTHLMGKSKSFLVPVCIDDTRDGEADVPDSFLAVQWTRLRPAGLHLRQAFGGQDAGQARDDQSLIEFGERVRGLLDRSAGNLPASGQSERGQVARTTQAPSRSRWIFGALGMIAAVALAIWQPWRRPQPSAPATRAPAPVSKIAAEVAQLRARLIPEAWKKEDFEPWSVQIDRLIAADDRNAEAWALRSIINSLQVTRLYDAGTQPLEVGRVAANRALLVSPGSPLAELALGMHYAAMVSRGGDGQAARAQLNRALGRIPPDPLTRYADLSTANNTFDITTGQQSALAWLESEPAAIFPTFILGALNLYQRNFDEVTKWAKRAASEQNASSIRAYGTIFDSHFYLHGDLAAAHAALDQIPPGARTVHRMIYSSWLLAMAERRWDAALQELARTPELILFDGQYYGPKAVLAGFAHRAAGREEAAQSQFREAERNVRELLSADAQNERLHAVLAVTLAGTGKSLDARNELALVEPLLRGRANTTFNGPTKLLLAEANGALGEFEPMLGWLRELLSGPSLPAITPSSLRIDPRFQNVIARPEMQKLLVEFAHLDAPKAAVPITSAPDQKSIAVLAFANQSSDRDDTFSDGISEELLNVLSRVPGLRVPGRTSSFSFKGKDATAQEIGQKLGVAYLVEGTVKKLGERVRITAKLINAADGLTMWTSPPLERESKDVWAVQDEIAGVIAQNLQLKLGGAGRVAKTVNPAAHQFVLQGRYFWARRTFEDFDRAEAAFQNALKLDPQFAQAHAGLADNCVMRACYRMLDGETNVAEDLVRTRVEAQRALALDDSLAEPHGALGYAFLLEGKLAAAEAEYRQMLALNPNYSTAHMWLGVLKNGAGRLDIALEEFEQATALDPLSPTNLHVWAESLVHAGRWDEALEMNARAASLRNAVYTADRGVRASASWQKGRKDDAIAAAREVRQLWPQTPRWFADADAIWVLQQAGLRDEASEYAARLLKELPAHYSHRGLVLAALGRFEEAMPSLERSGVMTRRTLFWDPIFDSFRNDPRFAQLMAKLGCTEEYKTARETLARLQREAAAAKR